jgi:hypothetical protein
MHARNQGCLSVYFASSWHLADAIFTPREYFLGEEDDEMAAMYKRRSLIGALLVLCVAIRYHHLNGISETIGSVYQGIFWTIEFALLSVIPAGVAILLYTSPKERKRELVQMRYPMTALVAAWLMIFVVMPLISKITTHIPHEVVLGLLLIIAGLAAELWLASFMIRALYLMATGLFRLRDGHPFLPPIVTVLAAWVLALKGYITSGGADGEPRTVAILMLIGGPTSLTVLAGLEIGRLKRKYQCDFPFRNGPLQSASSGSTAPRPGGADESM